MTRSKSHLFVIWTLLLTSIFIEALWAESPPPYSNATTDRRIHAKTPMLPRPRGVIFRDPDFGSRMLRVTDGSTNFKRPGTFLRTAGNGETNMWSRDSHKFYVLGSGGWLYAFGFDPINMNRERLASRIKDERLALAAFTSAPRELLDTRDDRLRPAAAPQEPEDHGASGALRRGGGEHGPGRQRAAWGASHAGAARRGHGGRPGADRFA